ncbi:MAG: PepSY domain-containing protein [Candidatus Pacebacteria bacterium]|nr:PepSY domain-containing protein [Candidatus Paceibacterota bacterium]
MIRKIKNSIEELQNKPEDTKIKTVWTMAVFCLIVISGFWFLGLKDFRKDVSFDYEKLPNFKEQISGVSDAFNEIENSSKIVGSQIKREEVIMIVDNHIKENDLLTEDEIKNILIDSVEKVDDIWVVNYLQFYENIPLLENKIYFKVSDEDKIIVDSNLNYLTDVKIDTKAKITLEEAYNITLEDLEDDNLELKSSNLIIYNVLNEKEENDYYLAWKISLFSISNEIEHHYYINANSGEIIDFLHN